MRELLKKPKPGDVLLSDPDTRVAHYREIADLVAATVDLAERASPQLQRCTELAFGLIRSSRALDGETLLALARASVHERSALHGATMLGLALGMIECERGWRNSPLIRRRGNAIRQWWEDQRPRWADRRVLEALVDLQRGALDTSLEAGYFVVAGYWHSFDEWE